MKLNNGIEIPSVGIGTFLLSPQDSENSVKEALKMDYRFMNWQPTYEKE